MHQGPINWILKVTTFIQCSGGALTHLCICLVANNRLKGVVSRDFGGLQMILMNRTWVRVVPLEVSYFFSFRFHIVFKVFSRLSFH